MALTVQQQLESLQQSQAQIIHQQNLTWNEKQKAQKQFQANQQAIADLEKYQQLKVNDWVTNQQQVGQIIELNLSPGGMPQVGVGKRYAQNRTRY